MKPQPTDYKQGVKVSADAEKTRLDYMSDLETKLASLYDSLEGWDDYGPDNIPIVYNIQRKLDIYFEIMEVLGDLSGECERFALFCDARKKMEYENHMLSGEEAPTQKVKEIQGHKKGQGYRNNRDYFKGLAKFWENRMRSTEEGVKILKWKIRDSHKAMEGH